MAGEVVGSVFVRVRAITTQIASDIQDGLDKGIKDVDVDAPGADLGAKLGGHMSDGVTDAIDAELPGSFDKVFQRIGKRLGPRSGKTGQSLGQGLVRSFGLAIQRGYGRVEKRFNATFGKMGALFDRIKIRGAAITNFARTFSQRISDAIPDGVGRAFTRARGKLSTLFGGAGRGLGRTFSFLFNEGFSDGVKNLTSTVSDGLDKVGKVFKKFKIPLKPLLYALAVPLIGLALQTLTVYVIGLVTQLGYLATAAAGAGVALGGVFGSLLLAAGPLVLAFKAMSPELLIMKDNASKVGKQFEKVGLAVQKKLFPAINKFLNASLKTIPMLKEFGSAVGAFTGHLLDMVRGALFGGEGMRKLNSIFDTARFVVGQVTTGIGYLVEWILNLWSAAGPITKDLAQRFQNMAKRWAEVTRLGEKSGDLGATLATWYTRAVFFGQAIKSFFKAIWNTFKIGADTAQPFFDTFKNFGDRWLKFTESDWGKVRIRQIFDDARPAVQAINRFIGAIIKLLFQSSTDASTTSGIAGFFNFLTYEVLPFITDYFIPTIMELKEPLKNLAVAVGELFRKMGELGILEKLIVLLTVFLETLTKIIELPGMDKILGGLLLVGAAFGLFGKIIGPLLPLLSGLFSFIGWLIPLITGLGSALTGAAAGSFAAFAAGLGIVLVAIVAVAGAAYLIYRNWDTISSALTVVWNRLVETARRVWEGITTAFNQAGSQFEEIKSQISTTFESFMSIVRRVGEVFGKIFGEIWATIQELNIGEAVGGWIDVIWENVQQIIPLVVDAFATIANVVSGVLEGVFAVIRFILNAIEVAWSLWGDNILRTIKGIWDAIKLIIDGAINIIAGVIKLVLAVIGGDWGKAWDAVKQIVSGVFDSILGVFKFFASTISGAVTAIVDLIVAPFRWLYDVLVGHSIIPDLVNAIVDWFLSIPEKIAGLASSIFNWVKEAAINAALKLAELTNALVAWIMTTIANLPEQMLALATTIWDWVSDAATNAADFLGKIFDAIVTWLTDAPGNLAEAIGGFASGFVQELIDALSSAIDSLPGAGVLKKGLDLLGVTDMITLSAKFDDIMAPHMPGNFDIPQFASGGLVKARRGGVIANIAERGFDEVVLSTDPRYAARNDQLLRAAGLDSGGGDSIKVEIYESNDPAKTGAEVVRRVRDEKFLYGGRSASRYRYVRR